MSKASVHPHGRGEHTKTLVNLIKSGGSSPRAWGTLVPSQQPGNECRFIPTGVGNTLVEVICCRLHSVHPHGRGEHQIGHRGLSATTGSSPRAWGTRYRAGPRRGSESVHPHGRGEHRYAPFEHGQDGRFIPTGVGNTAANVVNSVRGPVHPHGRGEHRGSAA